MPLSELSKPDVLLRENWETGKRLGSDGTTYLPPSFVATAGPRVWIIDVREADELLGPQGHIPGSWWTPLEGIGQVQACLPKDTPVVLVCENGDRSRTAARYLGALGMTTVAAMLGGMVLWRSEGYSVSRERAVLDRALAEPAPGCGSDGRPLEVDRTGERHLTREMIVDHVGVETNVRRVKLAAVLLANQTSCVDGREDRAIIGTFGGDAGEFLLCLAAAERAGGFEIESAHLEELTRAFADTFGGLYFHTDNSALNRLSAALLDDPRLEASVAGLSTVDDWEKFLRSPPRSLHRPLLDHLIQPQHVGCGHIKLAMTNPDVYGIRSELVTRFVEAFYVGLWNGARDYHWVVLGGEHFEGAVVNVTLEGELWPFSPIPMVAPSIGGVQMFVNHPQVVEHMREQTSRFIRGPGCSLMPKTVHEKGLSSEISSLGGAQANATLGALAKGLPVFNLHFHADHHFEVTQADSIPAS